MKERTDNEFVRNCQWQIHGLGMQSGRNKLLINELWQHLEITTGKKKKSRKKATWSFIQPNTTSNLEKSLSLLKRQPPQDHRLLTRQAFSVSSFILYHPFCAATQASHTLKRQRVFNTLFKSTCSNVFVAFDVILCSCTKGRDWLRSQCLSFTEHLGTKTKDFCHVVFHSACPCFLSPERWMHMGVINNAEVLEENTLQASSIKAEFHVKLQKPIWQARQGDWV